MDLGPLVPIVAIGSGLGWGWLGYKKRELAARTKIALAEASREREAKHKLEDRVRVLEKIITDKGYETAAQIEALREMPTLPSQQENDRV